MLKKLIKVKWTVLVVMAVCTTIALMLPYVTEGVAAEKKAPVKIGAIVWTEGPPLAAGRMFTRGFKSAISYVNKRGGILGGRQVEGVIAPQGMTDETAKAAALKLCMRDKVKGLLGPHWDGTQPAGLEVAKRFNIPYAPIQGGSWLFKQGYPGTISFCSTAPARTSALLRWVEKKGFKTAVMLFPDISYNHEVEKYVKKKWDKPDSPVKVLDWIWYTFGQVELRKELTKAVGQNPDIIWSEGWSENVNLSIMKILHELGYKGAFVTDGDITREAAEAMPKEITEGAYISLEWATDPNVPENKEFSEYWKSDWGRYPDYPESLVWSIVVFMLKTVDKVGTEPDGTKDWIMKFHNAARTSKWVSPRGPASISAEGIDKWDKMALAQIQGGQFKVVDYMKVYPNEYLPAD